MTIKCFEAKVANYVNGPVEQDYVIESKAEMYFIIDYIRNADKEYYENSDSEIRDVAYDKIISALYIYERDHPDDVVAHSPTCLVPGSVSKYFDKVHHQQLMRSILTITSGHEDALKKYVASLMSESGNKKGVCNVELKYDGLAVELVYRDGYLSTISTRGDGQYGECVTHNQYLVDNVPPFLVYEDNVPGSDAWKAIFDKTIICSYGEVIMLNSIFDQINDELESITGKTYSTARHAASGLLRTLKRPPITDVDGKKPLTYKPYNFHISEVCTHNAHPDRTVQIEHSDKYSKRMCLSTKLGIVYNSRQMEIDAVRQMVDSYLEPVKEAVDHRIHNDAQEYNGSIECGANYLMGLFREVESIRESLDFGIDGVVIKAEDVIVSMSMPGNARLANGHIALKFKPKTADGRVKDVINQVAKSGKITPVVVIEPVEISGITISRINLTNYDEIKRKGIKHNSRVIVSRGGDTIPSIVGTIDEGITPDFFNIVEPTKCPCCDTKLVKVGKKLMCPNTTGCVEQIVGTIIYWGSRSCMNIYGLSDSSARTLVEKCGVKSIADLYDTDWQSQAAAHFTKARIKVLTDSLKPQMSVEVDRIVVGLGIPSLGPSSVGDLLDYMCKHYSFCGFYEMFIKLAGDYMNDPKPLQKVIGKESSASLIKYLASDVGSRNLDVVSKRFVIDMSYYIESFENN